MLGPRGFLPPSLLLLPGADLHRGGNCAAYSSPPGSLQIITDVIGNPEEERRAAFYHQPWAQEAVGRHIFAKVRPCAVCPVELVSGRGPSHSSLLSLQVQQRRQELEQVLGIRLT